MFVVGIALNFILFGLTLFKVALFHHPKLKVVVTGLMVIKPCRAPSRAVMAGAF